MEALLIVSPDDKLVIGYEGQNSRFVYNTKFLKNADISSVFCLPSQGKMAIVFSQKN